MFVCPEYHSGSFSPSPSFVRSDYITKKIENNTKVGGNVELRSFIAFFACAIGMWAVLGVPYEVTVVVDFLSPLSVLLTCFSVHHRLNFCCYFSSFMCIC